MWGHLKYGHWCPYCDGQIVNEKEVRAFIEKKEGKIIDENWKYINKRTKIPIICKKDHQWNVCWEDLKSGRNCPYCVGHTVDENEAKAFIINKGGILGLNWKYIDSTTKFWVKCKECNHSWETHWNVIQQGHWCPHCKFKREQEFRKLIEQRFNANFPRRRPQWLKSHFATRPLELDGYNEKLKLAFEYQGEQHYELGHFNKTKEELEITQRKDTFKIETCNKMNVKLIIVPYWIPKESWIPLLNNVLIPAE